jgi:hypothetical protein
MCGDHNYYLRNRDRVLERQKKRYAADPKHVEDINKRSRQKYIEKRLAYQKLYREQNRDKLNLGRKLWYEQNRDRLKTLGTSYARNRRLELRQQLYTILGADYCVKCGEDDRRCLQFDHIKGMGKQEYDKRFRYSMMFLIYYTMHPDEAREKLQVLCANCNWKKRDVNGEHGGVHLTIRPACSASMPSEGCPANP